jgi:transposase-like protein
MTIEERHAHWRTIIENQAVSGKNIAAYCREGHIHTSLFYIWRRRLKEQPQRSGAFVELKPASRASTSGICLRLDDRLIIEVDRGFDPATLRAVVETLSRCSG